MVLLDEYKSGGHNINRALLWEYDVDNFDWQNSKAIVVQRVIEMGEPEDFSASLIFIQTIMSTALRAQMILSLQLCTSQRFAQWKHR